MTLIFSSSEHDTAEIIELRQRINDIDTEFSALVRAHRLEQRERLNRYDALLAASRPSYPTPAQLEAIDQVAELVHAGIRYGDHHGYPTDADEASGRALPRCAHFASGPSRLNVYAGAPRKGRGGARAWEFSDADISTLRAELHQRSLTVLAEWQHEDGVAFVIADGRG